MAPQGGNPYGDRVLWGGWLASWREQNDRTSPRNGPSGGFVTAEPGCGGLAGQYRAHDRRLRARCSGRCASGGVPRIKCHGIPARGLVVEGFVHRRQSPSA